MSSRIAFGILYSWREPLLKTSHQASTAEAVMGTVFIPRSQWDEMNEIDM